MDFSSLITHRVELYLFQLTGNLKSRNEADAEQCAVTAAAELGYGRPYDEEQACIHFLLIHHRANITAARAVWSFYCDFKAVETIKANTAWSVMCENRLNNAA